MGAIQSVAQGVINHVEIAVSHATISGIPAAALDVGLAGKLQMSLDLTNKNPLGAAASTRATIASLEFPVYPGYEDYAGEFAHFELPAIKRIGLGSQTMSFESDLVITNKTRLVFWTFGLFTKDFPLHVQAKPETIVIGIDPVHYNLNLHKEMGCDLADPQSLTDDPDVIAPVDMLCRYHKDFNAEEPTLV